MLRNDGKKLNFHPVSEQLCFYNVGTPCVYSKDTIVHNIVI